MATKFGSIKSDEIARELERIRREVLLVKQQLRERFEKYTKELNRKLLAMEAQLDEMVHKAQVKQVKLDQLIRSKAGILDSLQHNELNDVMRIAAAGFDEKIKGLEAIKIPSVWLEWRDEKLVDGMKELSCICEGVSYVNRQIPVWSGVDRGRGQNEILDPSGLSIDSSNGDVYACDHKAKIIQVFSREGIHQRTIRPPGLSYLTAIHVTSRHLFITCILPDRIYKVDKLHETVLCSVQTANDISGLTADEDTLYSGMYKSNQISHFRLEDLTTIKLTPLKSRHITQGTTLQDIKTTPSLFIVLFGNCKHPIQTFSRNGNLTQVIASQDQLNNPSYICVDRHVNIIVSDWGAHNLKIFSINGHLLTTIGEGGEGPGKFYNPSGIEVDMEGRIVVADTKESHMLQFF